MALRFLCRRILFSFGNKFNKPITSNGSSVYMVSVSYSNIRKFHISSVLDELVRFNLADIGEGIKEVTIKEWYIKVGDEVAQFDSICEVQSDKAAVTITSRYDGIVRKVYHKIDDVAQVGQPLIDIEVSSTSSSSTSSISSSAGSVSTSSVASSSSATSQSNICQDQNSDSVEEFDSTPSSLPSTKKVLTTPTVRKMAKDFNLDLLKIRGTGPNGRILKEDVLNFVNKDQKEPEKQKSSVVFSQPSYASSSSSDSDSSDEDKFVKFNPIEKSMFKTMTAANEIPHFNFCDEIDMTNLLKLRKRINKQFDRKMSFMPYFIKAVSLALTQYPQLNAQIDKSQTGLIYKSSHNIGFALASPGGLVVPKIYNVQNKSIFQIADIIQSLIDKGKNNKLAMDDLKDGTFTLSNIGNVGGTYTKPVILPPELVIGGIGRIQRLPRYNSHAEIEPADIMQISWSADHRAVDGMTMASFSSLWSRFLKNPELMIFYMK